MRVTDLMMGRVTLEGMTEANADYARWSTVASSGAKVSRPSDAPATYGRIVSKSEKVARLESRRNALSRAEGDLQTAESALAGAGSVLIRAREIAVQFSDETYHDNSAMMASLRATAANELTGLRQQLIAIANTKGTRGSLFAGSNTDQPAVLPDGSFSGNNDALQIEVADRQLADANVSGVSAFYATENVFKVLDDLAAAIQVADANLVRPHIDRLDTSLQQVNETRADAGNKLTRFLTVGDVIQASLNVTKETQAELQEGDMAENYFNLTRSQQAYERAVAVTRQVLSLASSIKRF